MMDKTFPIIEIRQQDWIPGFAAYKAGSGKAEGPAQVVLNLGSFIAAVRTGDLPSSEVPYAIAESVMHEVMHVLEEWAGVEFSEERVEALTEAYAAKYGNGDIAQDAPSDDPVKGRWAAALRDLTAIQYFSECSHKHRAWAWDALNALDPELAELAANNPKAAFDKCREGK